MQDTSVFPSRFRASAGIVALAGVMAISLARGASAAPAAPASFNFDLSRSAGVATCLPQARGNVRLTSHGANQQMEVNVSGLPANNTFTVFILQVPHSPFGMSWYQGDVVTNREGEGHAKFDGIFSDETFVMAPNVAAAPSVHPQDAITNPATAPIHTFHVGLWFDSVAEATAANCSANPTPFNGDHTAGVQVFNTTNFPDLDGPLGQFGR